MIIILVVVILIFGVGKLADVGGAVGRGIKEFRKSVQDEDGEDDAVAVMTTSEPSREEPRPVVKERPESLTKDSRPHH